MLLSKLLLMAMTASAASLINQRQASAPKKLLVGAPGSVLAAEFDGANFKFVANATMAGTDPSWMAFAPPNLVYVVDENSNVTRLFQYDLQTNNLIEATSAEGSAGVVFLEFNKDKTRMVAPSFGTGTIDVWDVTNGTLRLMKQLTSNDTLGPNKARQAGPHPHQAVLDPTGRFFAVNDLGTDTILVIDGQNDAFEIVNRVRVAPDGCGPRHGAFFPSSAAATGAPATHYILVCEILDLIQVYALQYLPSAISFVPVQVLSTFGTAFPPANLTSSTAGEVVIAANDVDVYVSNRNSGNATDSISRFTVQKATDGCISLAFADQISSGGVSPRMFSLSLDQSILFSTNQNGGSGLLALERVGVATKGTDAAAAQAVGSLVATPVGQVANSVFGASGLGPQFVLQIA